MFDKNDIILFQGDSITDCGRNREDLSSLGVGYANILSSMLLFEMPELNLTFYNKGISGNRIVDLYARFKEDGFNLKPSIISILIGVNDVWHEFSRSCGVEEDKFQKIYNILLSEIKEKLPKTKLILLEPFVLEGNLPVGNYKDWVKVLGKRQEIVKNLAKEYDAAFVPLQQAFDAAATVKEDTYWLYDGVHPTPAGHMLIAQNWLNAVGEL